MTNTGRVDNCMYGVVGVLKREDRLLLIQRSQTVRAPGAWCFPGGEIESGETPGGAIEREFEEEVGLRVKAIAKLWSCVAHEGRLHLEWWEVAGGADAVRPNPAEVQAFAWLTVDDVRRQPGLLPNNLRFLDHYTNGQLPGDSGSQ